MFFVLSHIVGRSRNLGPWDLLLAFIIFEGLKKKMLFNKTCQGSRAFLTTLIVCQRNVKTGVSVCPLWPLQVFRTKTAEKPD